LDVVEFETHVLDVLVQRHGHHRDAAAGQRFDLLDVRVLGDLLLDAPGDELLDLLRGRAGPGAGGGRDAHRDQPVLRPRHPRIGEDSPEAGEEEQHPGDVALLDEVPAGVERAVVDQLPVLLQLVIRAAAAHWITCTASPSATSVAPMTTTFSPSARPDLM